MAEGQRLTDVAREWAVASTQNKIYCSGGKSTETFIESPRNRLSLLLVSSIRFAVQPGAIQINTEEEVGALMAASERQILICSRCFMIRHNGLLEMATAAVARHY